MLCQWHRQFGSVHARLNLSSGKMKHFSELVLLLLIAYVNESQSSCDSEVVDKLDTGGWKEKPPKNLISQLNGLWTIYKTNIKNMEGVMCWQQFIDAKRALSTDVIYIEDFKDPLKLKTDVFEGEGFIVKQFTTGGHSYSDYLYSLYSGHGVTAWYCCGDGPEAFVTITVRDYETLQDHPEAQEALRRTDDVITGLGLEIPPRIPTECPTDISEIVPSSRFSIHLDALGLHMLYWTPDYDAQSISMELHSKISNVSWLALGFSDSGDISKADFCMVWTDSQNINRFQDIWTDEIGTVRVDGQQDCGYQGYKHDSGLIVAILSRKFDTCDDHDHVIEDGTMNVVWAVGLSPVASPGGLNLSAAQQGSVSTRLLRPLQADPPLAADVWTFDVTQQNFQVPKVDIHWCKMFLLSEKFKQKHHIVKFESVVTPGNEQLVHRIILKQCAAPVSPAEGPCHQLGVNRTCIKVLAMGLEDFSFPEEAGFALGGISSPTYAVLEVHYTPPDKIKDWVDSSGLRLHVTPRLRQYDADVLELGLKYLGETALPPGQRHFPVTSRCVASCTDISLPPEGITLFASRLHSHTTAVGMVTRHMRGGDELPEVVRENHYNVHKQPMWRLRRNVKVLPGDELITTCWFDTSKLSNVTLTGFGTTDEMCLDIVFYYPKVVLAVCKSSVSEHSLSEYFHKHNGQVSLADLSMARHADNFKKIKWTPERVEELLELYHRSPVDVQCLWGAVGHVPSIRSWSNITVVAVHPLTAASRQCASRWDTTDRTKGF